MTCTTNATNLSTRELLAIIESGEPREGVTRKSAIAALAETRSSARVRTFDAILADPVEHESSKQLAIRALERVGGKSARAALIENLPRVSPRQSACIAEALGRIGTPQDLELLRVAADGLRGFPRARSSFAVTLLSYRFGLDAPGSGIARGQQVLALGSRTKKTEVAVRLASKTTLDELFESLPGRVYGVRWTLEGATTMKCEGNEYVHVWNREFAGERLASLAGRTAVCSFLARRSRVDRGFDPAYVGLATPRRDGTSVLTFHRANGVVVFRGDLRFEDRTIAVRLDSVDRPGAAAMRFESRIRAGRFRDVQARSGQRVRGRQLPKRDA